MVGRRFISFIGARPICGGPRYVVLGRLYIDYKYILNFDPVDSDDFTEWSIEGGKPRIVPISSLLYCPILDLYLVYLEAK